MSNSKAKIACIHICPNKIRILEGRISDGFVLVTKTALIEKASRFYIGDRLGMPYLLPGMGEILLILCGSLLLSAACGPLASAHAARKISRAETYHTMREGE